MNTAFLLMAQFDGAAVIPVEDVCAKFFSHLTPGKFVQKISMGEIALPLIRIDGASQKSAKGVHLLDLAAWIDRQRAAAKKECEQLTGVKL
ncbi:MAG: Pyocin activator protein PrtN [Mesorhizobium sp.]|nr:MAG: Pyocin activator protein PrtN [Mesorhizobium sp.]TJV27489.1 MAG: Pyocin activator protein PrtN [Mesorhizobium sp.]